MSLLLPARGPRRRYLMAAPTADETMDVDQGETLKSTRSWLEYARRGSSPDALFTVSADVGMLYGSPRRPLDSERRLAEYALDFVNADTDRSTLRALLKSQKAKLERAGASAPLAVADQLLLDQTLIGARRAQWREFLDGVIRDRRATADHLLIDPKLLKDVWALPVVKRTEHGADLRYHPIILNLEAFDAFVRVLLVGEQYGSNLCQCKLPGCGRFFFVKKKATGRPQRLYCSRPHMLEAHAR